MNKPRETPLTDAFLASQAPFTREDVRVYFGKLERTVAELRKYVIHNSACKRRIGLYTVIPCDCGLDAILARLDGSKP